MRTHRSLLGIVLLLLVMAFSMPAIIGHTFGQKLMRKSIPLGENNHLIISSYHLGWFHGELKAKLRIDAPYIKTLYWSLLSLPHSQKQTPLEIPIHSDISFGPIILDKQGHLHLALAYIHSEIKNHDLPALATALGHTQAWLSARSWWQLYGGFDTHLYLPALDWNNGQKHFKIASIKGIYRGNFGKTHESWRFVLPKASIENGPIKAIINHVDWHSRYAHGSIRDERKGNVHVNDIRVLTGKNVKLLLENLNAQDQTYRNDKHTEFHLHRRIEKIQAHQMPIGPVTVTAHVVLDTPAWDQFLNTITNPQSENQLSVGPLQKLLEAGSLIQLKEMSIQTPFGPIALMAHWNIPTHHWNAQRAKGHVAMPQKVLESLMLLSPMLGHGNAPIAPATQIQQWVQDKWLHADQGRLSFDWRFEDNAWFVNNKPFSFQEAAEIPTVPEFKPRAPNAIPQ